LANASLPILFTFTGIIRLSISHSKNALLSIYSKFLGRFIFLRLLQFTKAPFPIMIILSGNSTVCKSGKSAQALLAITLVPSLTLISLPLFSYFIRASPIYMPSSSSHRPLS